MVMQPSCTSRIDLNDSIDFFEIYFDKTKLLRLFWKKEKVLWLS